MRNSPSHAYSQLVILRGAFEYEINNVLKLQERDEKVVSIIQYLEERLKEIREDEKACLKIQAS